MAFHQAPPNREKCRVGHEWAPKTFIRILVIFRDVHKRTRLHTKTPHDYMREDQDSGVFFCLFCFCFFGVSASGVSSFHMFGQCECYMCRYRHISFRAAHDDHLRGIGNAALVVRKVNARACVKVSMRVVNVTQIADWMIGSDTWWSRTEMLACLSNMRSPLIG